MYRYFTWIIAILIFGCSNAVPLSGFTSFGVPSGDLYFGRVIRAASQTIPIPTRLPYFTQTFNDIFVSSVYCVVQNTGRENLAN